MHVLPKNIFSIFSINSEVSALEKKWSSFYKKQLVGLEEIIVWTPSQNVFFIQTILMLIDMVNTNGDWSLKNIIETYHQWAMSFAQGFSQNIEDMFVRYYMYSDVFKQAQCFYHTILIVCYSTTVSTLWSTLNQFATCKLRLEKRFH